MFDLETDYYAILNLPPDSTPEEIREQFRRLVKMFHPDRNRGDKWCEQQLIRYNAAYDVLANPERKAAYDLHREMRQPVVVDFNYNADPNPAEEKTVEAEPSWSFVPPDPPAAKMSDAEVRLASVFGEAQVASVHTTRDAAPIERPHYAFRVFASLAGILVLGSAVLVVSRQPVENWALTNSQILHATTPNKPVPEIASSSTNTSIHPVITAMPTAITPSEMRVADANRHDQAVRIDQEIAPLRQRFAAVKTRSASAISRANDLIGKSNGADAERLRRDIHTLNLQLSSLQEQFDDLKYPSGDENTQQILKSLDQQLISMEQGNVALYQDIQKR